MKLGANKQIIKAVFLAALALASICPVCMSGLCAHRCKAQGAPDMNAHGGCCAESAPKSAICCLGNREASSFAPMAECRCPRIDSRYVHNQDLRRQATTLVFAQLPAPVCFCIAALMPAIKAAEILPADNIHESIRTTVLRI